MRASRLLSLLFILERRGKRRAQELADELEVSVRTLYRDVASLVAAGVPIASEPGPGGGIALPRAWKTRLDGLTAEEASALLFASIPQAMGDLGMFGAAVSARAKLGATLPADLALRVERVSERFHLDAPAWFATVEPLVHLPLVARAVWEGRKLDLRYGQRGWQRSSPLGLVLKAGVWYLVAGVTRARRPALRTFRVSRIEGARLRKEESARPDGFSLARHWREAARTFSASLGALSCEVRLSPRAFERLPHAIPDEGVRAQLEGASPFDAVGFRRVRLRLESEEVAASQLLALGDGVEVLSPEGVRRRLHRLASEVARSNAPRRRA